MSEYERQLGGSGNGDPQARGRSPEEIEREIEATRERMGRDIDELGERLSPSNLKRQAKDAITGKAQDIANNVGESARYTGSRMMDFVYENTSLVARDGTGRRLAHPAAQQERDLGRPDGAVRLHRAGAPQRGDRRQDRRPGRPGRAHRPRERELGGLGRGRAGQRSWHAVRSPSAPERVGSSGGAHAPATSGTPRSTAVGRPGAGSSAWSRRTRWRSRRAWSCWGSPPGCSCPRASGSSASWVRPATTW